MRHRIPLLMLLIGLAAPLAARAEDRPVVVELFTSQGCSSCPPADKLLGELGERENVIALAFHVDYWDYLGWRDTFADPTYTKRQRAYAPQVDRQWTGRNLRGSFTPEVVVQGTDSLIGSARAGILARIMAHEGKPPLAEISLSREGGDAVIRVAPAPPPALRGASAEAGTQRGAPAARIVLAAYLPKQRVEVKRGENAGRTLTYTHIVHDLRYVGDWDGKSERTLQVPDVRGPFAVLLQRGQAGAIIGAASLE